MDTSMFVDTASREPLGMSLTRVTSSTPMPGPATRSITRASGWCVPSSDGGTRPDAITPAFSRLR